MALSVNSLLRSDLVAFGYEADMRTVDRGNQSDVNDPIRTWAGLICRSATVSCRTEVCYPFCRMRGRNQAVKRREFITLLGGAAAAWPLTARGQQGERMRRIGVLATLPADDPEWQARLAAFRQGLQEMGWGV